jgi:hypothetical protein
MDGNEFCDKLDWFARGAPQGHRQVFDAPKDGSGTYWRGQHVNLEMRIAI